MTEEKAESLKRSIKRLAETFDAYDNKNFTAMNILFQQMNVDETLKNSVMEQHKLLLEKLKSDSVNDVTFQKYIEGLTVGIGNEEALNKNILYSKNPGVRNVIGALGSNMKEMYKKYKVFEFKYMQMNLFMLLMLTDMQKFMEDYTNMWLLHDSTKDEQYKVAIDDLFSKIQVPKNDAPPMDIELLRKSVQSRFQATRTQMDSSAESIVKKNGEFMVLLKDLMVKDKQIYAAVSKIVSDNKPKE